MILSTYSMNYGSPPEEYVRSLNRGSIQMDEKLMILTRGDNTYPMFLLPANKVFDGGNIIDRYKDVAAFHIYHSYSPMVNFTNKFWASYTQCANLFSFKKGNSIYWVGKGIICDEKFNPIVMLTVKLPGILTFVGKYRSEIVYPKECLTYYVSRKIFTEEWKKANLALHKVIFGALIPDVIEKGIKMAVKDKLNMINTTYVDAGVDIPHLQELMMENLHKLSETDGDIIKLL